MDRLTISINRSEQIQHKLTNLLMNDKPLSQWEIQVVLDIIRSFTPGEVNPGRRIRGQKKTKREKRACKGGRLTSYQGPFPHFKQMQSTKVLGTRADFNYMVL